MLDLAGLPLRAADRGDDCPLVIGGGPCACNPEPLVDFFDLFTLGEGEEVNLELMALYRRHKAAGFHKAAFLRDAAQIEGVYVPSLYEVSYRADGTIEAVRPLDGAPSRVRKRIIADMDAVYFPEYFVVPFLDIVHDRAMSEIFRGCIRGCRFCQAGYVYRPVRNRSKDLLLQYGVEALKDSGYQEMTLSSLSTSDYKPLNDLCDGLMEYCEANKVHLSLPSLRADNFSMELQQRLSRGRKAGLTFAPEAGSQRLRDVINKNLTEEDLLHSCRIAFEGGWSSVKLYFMLGLPTETDEDIVEIARIADHVVHTWRESAPDKRRGVSVTVSTSWFVPKPHTAFQWEAQITKEEYERRVQLLRDNIKAKAVSYKWHDSDTSFLEAVLSRGDRRIGRVLEAAWRRGAKMDAWQDYYNWDLWMAAFEDCGLDPAFYANRVRPGDEILPWSMISSGVSQKFLWRERQRAYEGITTPDCRTQCTGCGANCLIGGGKCDV